MSKHIEHMWIDLRESLWPNGEKIPPEQLIEMKKAFYAGASGMIMIYEGLAKASFSREREVRSELCNEQATIQIKLSTGIPL